MITYTGLVALIAMYMPWPMLANYTEPAAFSAEAYGVDSDRKPTGRMVTLAPVRPMVEAAITEWNGAPPRTIVIRNPGDAAATVLVSRSPASQLNARASSVTFSGADGEIVARSPASGPAIATAGIMLGLHLGVFADPAFRWFLFTLGLAGSAMVGTGLLLWTAKRWKSEGPARGLRVVERLNIAVIASLPVWRPIFWPIA